ncbi:MAG: alpha/beta hydrolase [Bacteroides sp.]|jgi:pimeloyl-ACP methyl ester carboxylesterase
MRDFREEYKAFLREYPYKTIEVDGVTVRYQRGGKEGAPTVLFFHGLEMQEMWMPYVLHFREKYGFLIYEYPFFTVKLEEQIEFLRKMLDKLGIEEVILLGASDGGVNAQMFAKKYPEMVKAMILTTTLTLDSDYIRNIKKEWIKGPIMINLMKIMPAKTLMKQLIKLSPKFLEYETPENKAYGISFYETVASDLQYKKRFIHSYTCVFMLRNCEYFKKEDFAYLHGKVQILVPEHDIFKKEDQEILAALFRDLDARIEDAPGGHVGFIVQADAYLEKIDNFLAGMVN